MTTPTSPKTPLRLRHPRIIRAIPLGHSPTNLETPRTPINLHLNRFPPNRGSRKPPRALLQDRIPLLVDLDPAGCGEGTKGFDDFVDGAVGVGVGLDGGEVLDGTCGGFVGGCVEEENIFVCAYV
jgi:hypothetical protein